VDAPSGPRTQIFVVVTQVPHQVGDSALAGATLDRPVVGDAGDATQRVVRFVTGGVHLADDGVFGAGHPGQGRQRRAHAVPAVVAAHRLQ
jgi:hypothetical protein